MTTVCLVPSGRQSATSTGRTSRLPPARGWARGHGDRGPAGRSATRGAAPWGPDPGPLVRAPCREVALAAKRRPLDTGAEATALHLRRSGWVLAAALAKGLSVAAT